MIQWLRRLFRKKDTILLERADEPSKRVTQDVEQTAADDYLDYLANRW